VEQTYSERIVVIYHVQEEVPEEDDPCDIHIEEAEGEREVEGPPLESK
jgi:hypothetical protein